MYDKYKKELSDLERKLDIDADIIEKLIRDIFLCDNFYIIGKKCENITDRFALKLKLELSLNKVEEYSSNTTFNDTDCILFISPQSDENELIEIASIAKDKGSSIYVVCSNRNNLLVSFANEFIHINNETNFIENTEYLLSTIYMGLEYHINSNEYEITNSQPLTMGKPSAIPFVSAIYCPIAFILEIILGFILSFIFGFNNPAFIPTVAFILFILGFIPYVMIFLYALIITERIPTTFGKISAVMYSVIFMLVYYFLFNIIMPLLFGPNFVVFPLFTLVH